MAGPDARGARVVFFTCSTAKKLPEADGFVSGFPTRFGMMAGQMKNFFDTTGQLWQAGALHGKPASMFTSTATQGGGQETTIMTAVTQLQDARGGSPWGAGTLAGPDGSRQPDEDELQQAEYLGELLAGVAKQEAEGVNTLGALPGV
ncbi:hypothetical protein HYH02_005620 [Chlamydomonas schloesseri]|uniref:NAD(P)H dehydrogenase (quinone) n=1 Tax=Chlamydomonas schloesseri TaxID=2026947 RepID=A0A835WML6_9CHLO|nr:hypothetical protein HYH02_005620 [Chlamydomonas schloesseri]|eukprot:KAG2449475.1 hypothetical protein HYH02_005620 [Chlamydomonas schloesseri]